MTILKAYYDLKYQVEVLTAEEEENWQAYQRFIQEKENFRQAVLDNINNLSFLKRELEKKLNLEFKALKSVDTLNVF